MTEITANSLKKIKPREFVLAVRVFLEFYRNGELDSVLNRMIREIRARRMAQLARLESEG